MSTAINHTRQRPGTSLVEVAVSTLLVGVVVVAALRTVGAATSSQFANGQRAQAVLLAKELADEILDLPYEDADVADNLGAEASEAVGGDRTAFDDVDDYDAWTSTPPVRRNGDTLPATNTWTRSVIVQYVDPNDLETTVEEDQGIKRVQIDVSDGAELLASVTFYAANTRYRNRTDD